MNTNPKTYISLEVTDSEDTAIAEVDRVTKTNFVFAAYFHMKCMFQRQLGENLIHRERLVGNYETRKQDTRNKKTVS